jgi:hypothetical protein
LRGFASPSRSLACPATPSEGPHCVGRSCIIRRPTPLFTAIAAPDQSAHSGGLYYRSTGLRFEHKVRLIGIIEDIPAATVMACVPIAGLAVGSYNRADVPADPNRRVINRRPCDSSGCCYLLGGDTGFCAVWLLRPQSGRAQNLRRASTVGGIPSVG